MYNSKQRIKKLRREWALKKFYSVAVDVTICVLIGLVLLGLVMLVV